MFVCFYFESSCSTNSLLNIMLNDSKTILSGWINRLKHLCIRWNEVQLRKNWICLCVFFTWRNNSKVNCKIWWIPSRDIKIQSGVVTIVLGVSSFVCNDWKAARTCCQRIWNKPQSINVPIDFCGSVWTIWKINMISPSRSPWWNGNRTMKSHSDWTNTAERLSMYSSAFKRNFIPE